MQDNRELPCRLGPKDEIASDQIDRILTTISILA